MLASRTKHHLEASFGLGGCLGLREVCVSKRTATYREHAVAGLLPFVTPVVALLGLLLALTVAVRNRSIFRPALHFAFRYPVRIPRSVPRKFAKSPPAAILFLNDQHQFDSREVCIPLTIANRSARRISEVVVELTYPLAFAVDNSRFTSRLDQYIAAFPEAEMATRSQRQWLEMRRIAAIDDLVHVRFEVGTLRPGESASLYEVMRFPTRARAFNDPRYELKMLGSIARELAQIPEVDGFCRITATVLSDLNHPSGQDVDVMLATTQVTEVETRVVRPFRNAYWLGSSPVGNRYFRPWVPESWKWLPPMRLAQLVEVIAPKPVSRVSADRDGEVVLAVEADLFKGNFGYVPVMMPGYDVKNLPASMVDMDDALRTIGFTRTL